MMDIEPSVFHSLFLRLCYQPLGGDPSKNHIIKYMVDGKEYTLVTNFKFRSNMGQNVRRQRGEVTIEIVFEVIGLFQINAEFDRPFAYTDDERNDGYRTLNYEEYIRIRTETGIRKYFKKDIDAIVQQHLMILSLST